MLSGKVCLAKVDTKNEGEGGVSEGNWPIVSVRSPSLELFVHAMLVYGGARRNAYLHFRSRLLLHLLDLRKAEGASSPPLFHPKGISPKGRLGFDSKRGDS